MARRDRRRGHADEFGPTDLAEDLERVDDAGDPADRFLHGELLAGESGVVDAGAAADPHGRLAAGERRGDRRGSGGVADPEFAEHQQVGVELVDGGERRRR